MQENNLTPWLYLDLNSYFASVEQQENPKLRGRPVAVIPTNTIHTCAIAASYEAKAYGVKTGTIIRDAKRMCPGLICIMARHDKYVEYHNRILSEVIRHAPINKIWSIDELSSRLPPNKRSTEAATALARRIKQGIWDNVGEAINCSIGLAPNSLLAKIATDMQKPNGLTVLTRENLQERLFALQLTDLPGVGPGMEKRLLRAGIGSIEALWNTSPKHARKIWGSVEGERYWYKLHGYAYEEPETQSHVMIGHSRVLDPALRRPDKARLMARRLLTKASQRLRRKGLCAQTVSLSARTTDMQKWRGELRLPNPAQDPFTFLGALDELWETMMHEQRGHTPLHGRLMFKKVSTHLLSLSEPSAVTGDLFAQNDTATRAQNEKRARLTEALDALQARYQSETVTLGVPPKTLSGYVGTKIAFSRVPDNEEFWE